MEGDGEMLLSIERVVGRGKGVERHSARRCSENIVPQPAGLNVAGHRRA